VLVSARRDAQHTSRGRPDDPKLFRNGFMLMKRLDRLSGEAPAPPRRACCQMTPISSRGSERIRDQPDPRATPTPEG
jgi:hypothetical protein